MRELSLTTATLSQSDPSPTPERATTPTTSALMRGKRKRKEEKTAEDIEQLKFRRQEQLLNAVSRVTQKKETKSSRFCDYICSLLEDMTPEKQLEAHKVIFDVVHNLSNS